MPAKRFPLGPQTFRAQDAPDDNPTKITIFVAVGVGMIVTVLLKLLYVHRNKKTRPVREVELAQAANENTLDAIEEDNLTDRKNPAFVYVY